jgi:light-regulated signal transduction histidine kinase (bacteriophytochrome)
MVTHEPDFAAMAAHDLQEPLRKVRAFSDRIRAQIAPLLTADTQDYFDRLQKSAERMQTLIEDLLESARVTSKGRPFKDVDLNEVVRGVLSDLEVPIDQSNATLNLQNLPVVQADPVQMRQLFQNLLSNALKFLGRIFTLFQRLHGRHEYEGSGIGLAICRKIVERHGGSLSAWSEPGKGATFIIAFPEESFRVTA